MAGTIRASLHRLVSRRSAPVRSSRPACRRRNRRAGDLPLRARRGERGAARAERAPARRRGALVAGAVAAGLAKRPRRARRAAGVAQGPAAEDHRRAGARDRSRRGVLERDRAGAASGRGRSGRRRAAGDRRRLRKASPAICWRLPPTIRNKEGRGLRVFTPFWRRVQALGDPPKPLPAPTALRPAPDLAGDTLESWRLEPSASRLGRRPARELDARRGIRRKRRLGEFLEGRRGRLCRRARPARSRRHLKAVAASALRRDQPAAGLARRALCRGRTPGACRRHRQVPERTGLARILPASAVRRARSRDAQPAAGLRRVSVAAGRRRRCAPGSAAGPAIRSSMPGCASSGTPASCTTGCGWWWRRSWSSTS